MVCLSAVQQRLGTSTVAFIQLNCGHTVMFSYLKCRQGVWQYIEIDSTYKKHTRNIPITKYQRLFNILCIKLIKYEIDGILITMCQSIIMVAAMNSKQLSSMLGAV